jgi:uncharacterized protein YodC (DUF2158 family)
MADFKEGDCVQIKHGEGPKMTIKEIAEYPMESGPQANCVWWDAKSNGYKNQLFALHMIKSCE